MWGEYQYLGYTFGNTCDSAWERRCVGVFGEATDIGRVDTATRPGKRDSAMVW